VLLASVLGSALAAIDATVVNIALPEIGRDLGASFAGLQWTNTGYTLPLAAFILLAGGLGDRFGRRRMFVVGVIWFALASTLCAVAPTLSTLVAARVLQGVGAALLTPASLAIIQASFVPEDRSAAIGTWAGFSGLSTAVAPFLGGWLLELGSWRWVFVVNIPIAVLVVAVVGRHVPETRDESQTGRMDWAASVVTIAGLAALTHAVMVVHDQGPSPTVLGAGGVAVIAFMTFILIERRAHVPLVPLSMFRSRRFTTTNVVTLLIYGAIGGFFFMLVLELQLAAGYSPLRAGTALLPVTVLTLLLSRRSGALAQRIGPRLQMTVGPLICAAGVLLALRLSPNADYFSGVLPAVAVFGLGLATLVAPLTSVALASAAPSHAGIASGVNNAVARAGTLLAVAALPALSGLRGDPFLSPSQFTAAYRNTLLLCTGLLLVGAVVAVVGLRSSTSRVDQGTVT
jgi:EmrB/QacA subfamily drug resistance transporter